MVFFWQFNALAYDSIMENLQNEKRVCCAVVTPLSNFPDLNGVMHSAEMGVRYLAIWQRKIMQQRKYGCDLAINLQIFGKWIIQNHAIFHGHKESAL